MAVRRNFSIPRRKAARDFSAVPEDHHWRPRVVEHEMDMARMEERSSTFWWVIETARRLMGLDYRVVKPPRRAVERENEEAWPSRE